MNSLEILAVEVNSEIACVVGSSTRVVALVHSDGETSQGTGVLEIDDKLRARINDWRSTGLKQAD